MLLPIPHEPFSRAVYVDENALQPGQTATTWSMDNVAYADVVSEHLLELASRGDDEGCVSAAAAHTDALPMLPASLRRLASRWTRSRMPFTCHTAAALARYRRRHTSIDGAARQRRACTACFLPLQAEQRGKCRFHV